MIVPNYVKDIELKKYFLIPAVSAVIGKELACLYFQERSTAGETIDIEICDLQVESAKIRNQLQQCSCADTFQNLTDELNEIERRICILLHKFEDEHTLE